MRLTHTLSALALLAISATASANLVTNGDFSAGGTGWTLTGNTGYNSFPGTWHNGAVGSNAFLSQTIATVSGQTYEVNFDTQVNSGFTMAFTLDNFANVFTATSSGHYDFFAVAGSNNATLTFITRNDPSFNDLDNVVVTGTVPEPGSLALLGLGIAGLGIVRRKKSIAA